MEVVYLKKITNKSLIHSSAFRRWFYLDGQYLDGDGHTIYVMRGYTQPWHAIRMNMAKLGVRQWSMIGDTS
jgi:hypothetical protein